MTADGFIMRSDGTISAVPEEMWREFSVRDRRPNISVEPTAYAAPIRIVMDSLFTLISFHSSAPRLWLTSIR